MTGKLLEGLDSLPSEVRQGVLTIGNFDGVHVGHQRILSEAKELATSEAAVVVAMTFDPPPDLVLRPADAPERLTLNEQKGQLLISRGADWVVTVRPTPKLLALPAEAFIERVIVGRFDPHHLVEGHNFLFGRERSGTIETLREAGPSSGFQLQVVEPVLLDFPQGRQRVSSTLIRGFLRAGNVEQANRCLGREFAICGRVVAGQGQGRRLACPTVNIDPGEQIVPADGVYAGRGELGGREYVAAISIGNKPTFGPAAKRVVEAHLLDAQGDFYEQTITLRFVRWMRDQQRFEGPQALKAQMTKDIQHVRDILG